MYNNRPYSKLGQFKFLIISFLLVVGLLPGLFGLIAIYKKSKSELIASKGIYFKEVASFTAYQIETTLQENIDTIKRLARLPIVFTILKSEPGKVRKEINNFKRVIEPEMANKGIVFNIYNASNNIIFSSEIIYPGIDLGKTFTLANIKKDGKIYISDIIFHKPASGHTFIEIYAPIVDEEGKNIGSIQAKYIVDRLFETIKNIRIGKTGHANLVISSGEILVCPIFAPRSHKINNELLLTISGSPGWAVVNDDAHGSSGSLVGYSPVNLNKSGLHPDSFGKKDWFIFTRQEPYETIQSIDDFRKVVIWYAVVLAFLVLALGLFAFQQIMKAQKAHQVDVVHRGKAESIKRLMTSFQEMMFDPLDEFGKWMDELDVEIGKDKAAFSKIKKLRHYLSGMESLMEHLKYYTGANAVHLEPVDLFKIVNDSIFLLDYIIVKKDIAIIFAQPNGQIILQGQSKLLNIVFFNIILNAVHAIDGKGKITITTEKNKNWGVCKIADNGKGISKDDMDHIYDPFFTTKKGRKSYGLGLSISRGIIEEHGGDISVKSAKGKGTQVTIRLKIAEENNSTNKV